MKVVQLILRPETTMKSYAHEPIFWFISRYDIKIYTGYFVYGVVCIEIVSRSTRNRLLLVRVDDILYILISR